MATAKKLPSGKWRVLIYDGPDPTGKRHYKSFTAETKKEAEYLAASYKLMIRSRPSATDMTLKDALQAYCDSKTNVLSPSTLRDYLRLISKAYGPILSLKLSKVTQDVVQRWANTYAVGKSPKTVNNAYSLLHAALSVYAPYTMLRIKLPQKIKPSLYVPTDADVQKLIAYLSDHDHDMLIAVYLAAFGSLRRSEICALTAADVDGCVLHISKAVVQDTDKRWITKTTKTTSSTRDVEMPEYIINELPAAGQLVNITPNIITSRFNRALGKLDIPRFRFHDLRHYCASVMHALGIPDVYIMQRGGWGSDGTLQRVYRNVMNDYQDRYTGRILDHFDNMQHEMQHKKKKPT